MRHRFHALAAATLAIAVVPIAHAEDANEHRDWQWSFAASETAQADADLDRGGEVNVFRSALSLSARRQATPDFGIGFNVRYTRDRWDFTDPVALGGAAPWRDIDRFGVGLQLRGRLNDTWQWIVAPTVQYVGEEGASSSDAMTYGAAFAFSRRFSPDLDVTLGVAAIHDIDENRVRPYVAVNWKIDEHWRLGTPQSAAPAGLAGFELGYRRNETWDFGVGLGFGEYRFRLDDDGPTAGGVGESRSIPLYGRVSYRPNDLMRFDAYAGASFSNRVRVEYGDARGTLSEDYDTAPTVGLSVTFSP